MILYILLLINCFRNIMSRDHKKKPGSRRYINYSDELLNEALSKVVTGAMSLRAASREYNNPFGTLSNKYKGNFTRTPGAQPIFSHTEEKSLLKAAAKCSDWGYPLTALDLRFFAKAYLDRQGRHVARFQNILY
ncbi:hypothetical protein B5X24_HaOG208010 [Helicoverpa armigera]|uniref:HTH psq-type domain-containing protein n=1 Tax=Helicoverpa armigera TaxID=29058 RepID=A0A2W1BHK2_HELAM|nr:hypothetical protein B5X24_HaOG208010 [Helicoverpa armigera]